MQNVQNMQKRELEAWLCGADAALLSPATIASLLGVAPDVIADTTLLRTAARRRVLQFTLAVLRDVFADDGDVHCWLRSPRVELGGRSALDLLFAGQMQAVEELAMRTWRGPHDVDCALAAPAPFGLGLVRGTAGSSGERRFAPAG